MTSGFDGSVLSWDLNRSYDATVTTSRSGHQLIFFLLAFCSKSPICLESKSMTPSSGRILFLFVTSSNSLILVSVLLQRFDETVRCVAIGAEVPGHPINAKLYL